MDSRNLKKRKLSFEMKKNVISKINIKSNNDFNSLSNIGISSNNFSKDNNPIKFNFNNKLNNTFNHDMNDTFNHDTKDNISYNYLDCTLQKVLNKLDKLDNKIENINSANKNYLDDFSKKILTLQNKIDKNNEDLNNYYKKINIKYLVKDIGNTNMKINKIEDSINELTREINDLQVHALHGNFELNKEKIKELEDKELKNFSHIYN